ncbi:M10 family metallopeptidase [Roseobacteraceae bacterium S113]
MEAWEMVADLEFIEVASGEMITMDDESSGAWAYAPGGFDASGVELNVSKNWLSSYGTQIDDYSFQTYIHEIGHALGLGHQGSYNGSADYGEDNTFANDSWQMSVMSYFSQTENSAISASYANTITAMMADVLAIQNLYGAAGAGSATAGNTTWGQGSNLGNFLDAYFAGLVSGSFDSALYGGSSVAFTIADVGGVDVLNLAFTDADNRIDMVAESFSDVDGLIGNVGIARGTVLENLVLGAGDDTVTGNDAANRIESGAGDDSIEAGVGADRIFAGEGNDVVMAGLGVDVTFLNQGDDIYLATGNDMSADTIWGGYGDDSITADGGGDNLLGEWGRDTLVGGSGNDQLHGGDDDDSLVAGAGADTVWGGFGRDTVFLNQGNDRFNDNGQGGEAGRDTVWGGYGRDTIQGGNGDDVFYGEWGNDVIFGRKGNDSIYGGTNFDYLSGGAGDDLIYGGYGRDRVIMGLGDDRYVDTAQTSFYGDDTITGGSGADTFVFDAVMAEDVITDFELGVDVLEFSVALAAGRSTNALADLAELRAEGVLLSFGEGQSILLQGLTTSSGLADDIVIV